MSGSRGFAVAPASNVSRGTSTVAAPAVTPAAALLDAVIAETVEQMRHPATWRSLYESTSTRPSARELDRIIRATETRELARQLARRVWTMDPERALAARRAVPRLAARFGGPLGAMAQYGSLAADAYGYGAEFQRAVAGDVSAPGDLYLVGESTDWVIPAGWLGEYDSTVPTAIGWANPYNSFYAGLVYTPASPFYPWIADSNAAFNAAPAAFPWRMNAWTDYDGVGRYRSAVLYWGEAGDPADVPIPPGTTTVMPVSWEPAKKAVPRLQTRTAPGAPPPPPPWVRVLERHIEAGRRPPPRRRRRFPFRPRSGSQHKVRMGNYHKNITIWALEGITEAKDFVGAVYEALPAELRRHIRSEWVKGQFEAGVTRPPRQLPTMEQAEAIWRYRDQLDVVQAVRNLAWEAIEDTIFGKLGSFQADAFNNIQRRSGLSGGGEWANRFGEEEGGRPRSDGERGTLDMNTSDPFRIGPPPALMQWLEAVVKGR